MRRSEWIDAARPVILRREAWDATRPMESLEG